MIGDNYDIQVITLGAGLVSGAEIDAWREEIGGKAQGLLSIQEAIAGAGEGQVGVGIPKMTVLGVSLFDAFMDRNDLWGAATDDLSDERIAHAFQQGDMPFEALGPLRALVAGWTTPLAVRSSGLLEDSTDRPFAGVYLTKMIPNNAPDLDTRFQKLVEAVKFVWASTFFRISKDYCQATGLRMGDEKMAVIIQEMVGKRHSDRFYPELSGVARSFNYYPIQPARPEDGVVNLALGLGKTIVDGGKTWTYSPAYPQTPPPYHAKELLRETQNEFWAVNLGEPPEYDPINETEYMRVENLRTAERDGALRHLASTYDLENERFSIGVGSRGPRVLTFSPLLELDEIPFNRVVSDLLFRCEEKLGSPVEIEFAMTFDPPRLGFLQVRPMALPEGDQQVTREDLQNPNAIIASENVLGNGALEGISDVVYVIPERFNMRDTRRIADELAEINQRLLEEGRPYILIVFGRLGTLDPWLGIPVTWGQVCGARVVVEASQENARVELSQGSHYFHNIINLGVFYFCVPYSNTYHINWEMLNRQPMITEGKFTRHARLTTALHVRVDGHSGRGIIYRS